MKIDRRPLTFASNQHNGNFYKGTGQSDTSQIASLFSDPHSSKTSGKVDLVKVSRIYLQGHKHYLIFSLSKKLWCFILYCNTKSHTKNVFSVCTLLHKGKKSLKVCAISISITKALRATYTGFQNILIFNQIFFCLSLHC